MFKRIAFFAYGVIVYAIFLPTFLYAIGFVGNFSIDLGAIQFVPKGLDSGGAHWPWWQALILDLVLLGLFAVQHSVMARRGFKRVWTQIIPPEIERSTFVLASSLALIVLFIFWQPIGGTLWVVQAEAARWVLVALSLAGWSIVLVATFLINHFDLFGLRQVYAALRNREPPALQFATPFFYRLVRHPIYLGFVIAFWATPVMTVAHFVFAVATTGYMLVGIQLEERDLLHVYGDRYRDYRDRVRMLIPIPRTSPPQVKARSGAKQD